MTSTARSSTATARQVVLITGATAGIGRRTALHLAAAGYHVIATGRRVAELEALRKDAPGQLSITPLDVTSAASIAAAVAEVDRLTDGHGVDALVNNAGFGVAGPLTEISDAELRRQYDTNVFGLMAVTRAFVPQMRARGRGRIINVSSMGGKMTLPFFGAYNSTKYALESLSDALRMELHAFGIDVVLIEPGAIHTNFGDTAMSPVAQFQDSAYAGALAKAEVLRKRMEATAVGPQVIARAIHKAIRRRRPAARYVAPWFGNVVLGLLALTPTRIQDAAMRRLSFLTRGQLGVDPARQRAATVAPPPPVAAARAQAAARVN